MLRVSNIVEGDVEKGNEQHGLAGAWSDYKQIKLPCLLLWDKTKELVKEGYLM